MSLENFILINFINSVFKFENVVASKEKEVKRLLEFLKIEVADVGGIVENVTHSVLSFVPVSY